MRKILVEQKYSVKDISTDKNRNIYPSKYSTKTNAKTMGENIQGIFMPTLSIDVDIFNELPKYVYDNKDLKNFLNVLRKVLLSTNLEGITLSKLCVSEKTESGIVLDWIFNYFRVYFSFDLKDGNFFGIVSSNPEKGSFFNEFEMIDSKRYEEQAENIVDHVIKMISA